MKYLLGMVLVLLFTVGAWAQEADYEQLFFEQTIRATQLELRITQLQYRQLQRNLALSQEALRKHKAKIAESKPEEKKVEQKDDSKEP